MSNPLFKTVRLPGDGLELAADAFGDPSAPPVLFFHGGGQSRRSWRGSAARIAQAGYYALTFDLRGHGESGWATDGDYLLDAYASDIKRLRYAFDQDRKSVVWGKGVYVSLYLGGRCICNKITIYRISIA